tara:strand:+ start:5870 stop:6469 length:600 start_codon:yes stop_codon:yes gene_type:complete
MILINHRVNSIKKLKNTPFNFGVEIDLRSEKNKIYLHHDPFKKGVSFEKWIKFFRHKIIVLNVKEEGLETKVLKILKKNNVKNFFFHDQTFSTLLKNMNRTKVSIRFSEYEDLKKREYLFKKIKWLWLDNFNKIDLDHKFYKYLKNKNVKICIVSPELAKKSREKEIKKIINKLKINKIELDAVCTKKPNLWSRLLNNE